MVQICKHCPAVAGWSILHELDREAVPKVEELTGVEAKRLLRSWNSCSFCQSSQEAILKELRVNLPWQGDELRAPTLPTSSKHGALS